MADWSIPASDYETKFLSNIYYIAHNSSSLGTLLFDLILKYTSFPSLISIRLLSSKSHKMLHNSHSRKRSHSRKKRWNQREIVPRNSSIFSIADSKTYWTMTFLWSFAGVFSDLGLIWAFRGTHILIITVTMTVRAFAAVIAGEENRMIVRII